MRMVYTKETKKTKNLVLRPSVLPVRFVAWQRVDHRLELAMSYPDAGAEQKHERNFS